MNPPALRVLVSDTHDPWFNLSIENWIFRDMDPLQHVLFLWRNRESVVIGRFQNPWTECRVLEMERDGISLVRRQSGGGAVYQDLNNSNFTFMAGRDFYSREDNFAVVLGALEKFGIKAEKSGRNDILVEGRKVSGSAFKNSSDRSFHHGTMLIDADLEKLTRYLNPGAARIETKGIVSVRSQVANLREFNPAVDHDAFCTAMVEEFFRFHGVTCAVEHLVREDLELLDDVRRYYEMLRSWDWRFGKTPKFSRQVSVGFAWGGIELFLDCHNGIIEDIRLFSEALDAGLIETVRGSLIGIRYSPGDVARALADTAAGQAGAAASEGLQPGGTGEFHRKLQELARRIPEELSRYGGSGDCEEVP
ncbi:MAG: lipoate--protein ligase [Spirochaetia bacterium]